MNLRVKALSGIRTLPTEATANDLQAINADFSPTPLAAEDIHVRKARVAHNQVDRTLERFQKAQLDRFAETLPGRSVLPGHNTSELPLGRWFEAGITTRVEEFPVLVRRAGKGVEIVPGMETARPRVTWLEASFYFINDPSTDALRKNIDSGVYQDVSIGFSFDDIDCDVCKASYLRSGCPHYRGERLEDGSLVTLTYSGDPKAYEARECSLVYLGAQQHAELLKSLRSGTADPEALARCVVDGDAAMDLVALKEFEALARIYGHQQKVWGGATLGGDTNVALTLTASSFRAASGALNFEVSPSLGGDRPAPDGDGDPDHDTAGAALAPGGEKSMEFLKKVAAALGLPETATEEEALTAAEQAKAKSTPLLAVGDYDEIKAAKETAETQAGELKGLVEKAFTDLKNEALADYFTTEGKNSPTFERLLDSLIKANDYAGLKETAKEQAEKAAAFRANLPGGLTGDPSASGDDPAKPQPKEQRRSSALEYELI